MPTEIHEYICDRCGTPYTSYSAAEDCEDEHLQVAS